MNDTLQPQDTHKIRSQSQHYSIHRRKWSITLLHGINTSFEAHILYKGNVGQVSRPRWAISHRTDRRPLSRLTRDVTEPRHRVMRPPTSTGAWVAQDKQQHVLQWQRRCCVWRWIDWRASTKARGKAQHTHWTTSYCWSISYRTLAKITMVKLFSELLRTSIIDHVI